MVSREISAKLEEAGVAGPGLRPREAPLFDLAQAAAQIDRLLAALRHLRLPGDRRRRGRLLPRAGRRPPHLAVRAGAVQGLHLDAQAQQLPLDPHHRGGAAGACASRCRSAPRRWTWWPRRASPPTGATRTRAYGFDPEAAEAAGGRDPLANLRQLVQVLEHGGERRGAGRARQAGDVPRPGVRLHAQGSLVSLPRGAMPLDFAYAVHTDVGDTCVGVKINGELRPLRTELTNGDVVEVVRGPKPTSLADWRSLAITGRARSAIRRHIRQAEKEEFTRLGRASLERTLERAGKAQGERLLAPGAGALRAGRRDRALRRGRPRPRHPGPGAGGGVPGPEGDRARRRHRAAQDRGRTARRGSTFAAAASRPGVELHFAPCCKPVPGDRIVGIVARAARAWWSTRSTAPSWPSSRTARSCGATCSGRPRPSATPSRQARLQATILDAPGVLGQACAIIGEAGGNIIGLSHAPPPLVLLRRRHRHRGEGRPPPHPHRRRPARLPVGGDGGAGERVGGSPHPKPHPLPGRRVSR